MATGDGVPSCHEHSLMCAVCLGVFTDPKLLPCFHTFCALCIQDVADRHEGSSFPCPSCREPTSLPSGGAAALQSNFYIRRQELDSPRDGLFCLTHEGKELDLFCIDCDIAICVKCMPSCHKIHNIVDLQTAADGVKDELPQHKTYIENAIAELEQQIKASKEDQKALLDKKAAVERNIHERHATIVAAADKFRDEALDSLRSVSTDIERVITNRVKEKGGHLEKLQKINRQLEQTLHNGRDHAIITVAKEIKSGCCSREAVSQMISHNESTVCRPVLRVNVTADVIVQKARDFMGTVTKVEMEVAAPEVTVVERFRCGEDTDIEVFALCHVDQNPPCVSVSYDRCGLTEITPWKQFEEKGKLITTEEGVGRTTHKRFAKGRVMCPPSKENNKSSFCKSRIDTHYRLKNYLSGCADIKIVTVKSKKPFRTERKRKLTIKVGAHRAFDVDDKEQFSVVVEEAKLPDTWRKVLLYHRASKDPVAIYTPPTPAFHPSDVCFYTLGHQHLLLVCDELSVTHPTDNHECGRVRSVVGGLSTKQILSLAHRLVYGCWIPKHSEFYPIEK